MGLAIRAFFIAFFGVIKRWKIVFFLFFFNMLFAAFLASPLFLKESSEVGHFGGLSDFLKSYDPELLVDFTHHHGELLKGFFLAAGIGGLLYYFFFNILSGGVIAILSDPAEGTTLKTFFSTSGRYAFRFTRLLGYFAVLLAVIALINHSLDKGLLWYFNGYQDFGSGSGALGWTLLAKNLLMVFLLAIALISFNYAKVAAVMEHRHFMGGCLFSGMGFAMVHPLVTGIYFILAAALLVAVLVGYAALSRWIDPEGTYLILENWGGVAVSGALLYIVLAQCVQLMTQACLVLRHAGQVYIYRYLTVQSTQPDPELVRPDTYAPFIPDRPAPDSDASGTHHRAEGPFHA